MHNYYRALHGSLSLKCDPNLAKSAQDWADEQASNGRMYHSPWTDQYTESISWKGDGWEGMDSMNGSIPGAVRSWYSEIKNDYNYETGESTGNSVGHFQAVVWKGEGEKSIGCGLNIKEGDGTYVTVHYSLASHANTDGNNRTRKNVAPRREPGKGQSKRIQHSLQHLFDLVERCWLLLGWENGFNTSSTFDSTKLPERPCIQSQAVGVVVAMDTHMLRH